MERAMSILKRSRVATNYATGVLILLSLSGCCLIGGQYLADEPIGKKVVERTRPGQTSVREVLTRLGPPIAIARQGQTMVFPPPAVGTSGFLDVPSDSFFELFSSNRLLGEEEVVYYYQASRVTTSGFLMILLLVNGGGQTERVKAEQLWLLVNEKTGIIEDYRYRNAGRPVKRSVSSPELELGSH